MKKERKFREFVEEGEKRFIPSLSLDCVIFGFHDDQLSVLLLKLKHVDGWMLPGGFIRKTEEVDRAAHRVLKERTGLDDIFLQQFHVFGKPDRSDRNLHKRNAGNEGFLLEPGHWLLRRFITIGYYALVEYSHVQPVPDDFSELCEWHDMHHIPTLKMDHADILAKALETLRLHLAYHPVGFSLLPEKFTMPQLQRLYETILGRKLDRRNFQRKMLGYGILRKLSERKKGGAHKAPFLYKFDVKKYQKALAEGLESGW
jgi:ADP-ribose pyrophosphatase YjhB (NUDIX family)